MIMKLPATNGSGNGYYGHDSSGVISSYLPDGSDLNQDDDDDSPTPPGDFSEYMWMENEEEFDKQVMQQLEEEALMEQCIEAMLEDEQEIRNLHNQAQSFPASNNCNSDAVAPLWNGVYATYELCQDMSSLGLKDDLARKSTLNPNAAEFVPGNSSSTTLCGGTLQKQKEEHLPTPATSTTTTTNSDSKDTSQAKTTA